MDGDGEDSAGGVDGRAREHLLEVEGEGVGSVHHGSESSMNLRGDEGAETGDLGQSTRSGMVRPRERGQRTSDKSNPTGLRTKSKTGGCMKERSTS